MENHVLEEIQVRLFKAVAECAEDLGFELAKQMVSEIPSVALGDLKTVDVFAWWDVLGLCPEFRVGKLHSVYCECGRLLQNKHGKGGDE